MPIYHHFLSGQVTDFIRTFSGMKHPHSLHSLIMDKLSHSLQMSYLALASGIASVSDSVFLNDSSSITNHVLPVQMCQF